MIIPREAESAGQAGATPRAPGRRAAARSLPRLAAAVSMVGAVTVFGPANHTDGPADAAAARSHATAMPAGTAAASQPRSGLAWASGAYPPSATPGAAAARSHATAMPAGTAAASQPRSGLTRASGAYPPSATPGAAAARMHSTAMAAGTAAASRHRSGLTWASGAYLPSATPAAAAAFGAWREHPLDIAEVWPNRSTWASIVDPAWLYRTWEGSPYTMVISVAMLPTDVPGASIRACANGTYNAHWRQFGQMISSYGLGSSIIRLGWEFNGNWYPWAATDPTAWAECWRQAVTSAWSTAPRLRWDWNVNRGASSALADPTRAYPGNQYVSMIGIDSYDMWPPVVSGGWQQQLDGKQGLNYWLAFAKAHGKKLSVPEWGSVRYGRSAGGDDPRYIRDMRAFFAANAPYIAFEAIFESPVGNYPVGHTTPNSAQAYKADF